MTNTNDLRPNNEETAAVDSTGIDSSGSQAGGLDDWASAFAEQNAGEAEQSAVPANTPEAGSEVETASNQLFKPLQDESQRANLDIEALKDVPLQMTVELGRTRLTIRELLQLGQGSVVELAGLAGEPMDILINGHLIAQGEVVVVGDNYGVRLTDILTPSDRLHRLTMPR